ncbi:MAG: hypothetical protein F6K39_09795 [Okeania sp. SIO3B3]|nr:hypothetical protein [Okeania sp. SIO3B3]
MTHADHFAAASFRRGPLLSDERTTCCRLFSGEAEGIEGVYVDRLGPAAIANIYEGTDADRLDARRLAEDMLRAWSPTGVTSVYMKRFPKDRSRLGKHDAALSDPEPAAGVPLPDSIEVREHGLTIVVRPYDGFSTGLFVDQRGNRGWLRNQLMDQLDGRPADAEPIRVCNTFAYTGAFGLSAAAAGRDAGAGDGPAGQRVTTTNIDVSDRYLSWAKDNYAASGLDPTQHFFTRADARDFLAMASRKGWRFGAIVLDPPTFGAADKKRKIPPWRADRDYPTLIAAAAAALAPGGVLLCSTNTQTLCAAGALEHAAARGLGARPGGSLLRAPEATYDVLDLPAPGVDVELESARFAAIALRKRR